MFGITTANKCCKAVQHFAGGWNTLAKGYEVGAKYKANLHIIKEAGKYSKQLSKLQQKYPSLNESKLDLIK